MWHGSSVKTAACEWSLPGQQYTMHTTVRQQHYSSCLLLLLLVPGSGTFHGQCSDKAHCCKSVGRQPRQSRSAREHTVNVGNVIRVLHSKLISSRQQLSTNTHTHACITIPTLCAEGNLYKAEQNVGHCAQTSQVTHAKHENTICNGFNRLHGTCFVRQITC